MIDDGRILIELNSVNEPFNARDSSILKKNE